MWDSAESGNLESQEQLKYLTVVFCSLGSAQVSGDVLFSIFEIVFTKC